MPVAPGEGPSARPPPIALLALVTAIAPAALHMLVPALPLLAVVFDAASGAVQLVLTLYLAGIAVGQLVYGPVSDRFGRRPVLTRRARAVSRRHGAVRARLVAAGVDHRPHAAGAGRLRRDGAGPGNRARRLRPRALGERLGDDHDGDEPGAVAVAGDRRLSRRMGRLAHRFRVARHRRGGGPDPDRGQARRDPRTGSGEPRRHARVLRPAAAFAGLSQRRLCHGIHQRLLVHLPGGRTLPAGRTAA